MRGNQLRVVGGDNECDSSNVKNKEKEKKSSIYKQI